jgi:hypothetical protein
MRLRSLPLLAVLAGAALAANIQPTTEAEGPPSEGQRTGAANRDLATLIEHLGHDDWEVRERATEALIAAGNAAREALRETVESDDTEVRWRARYALTRLHDSLSLPPRSLARTLYRSAAMARARKDSQAAARHLYREVVERFPDTRWGAAARERLEKLDAPDEPDPLQESAAARVKRLIDQLASPDWRTRQTASHRLAQLGQAARPALEQATRGADPELAWRARSLLDRLAHAPAPGRDAAGRQPRIIVQSGAGLQRAVNAGAFADLDRLVDTLGSAQTEQVEAARELLLNIGDDAIGPLVRGLDRADEVASVEIADLLQRITGETLGYSPERWKAWWDQQPRR